MKRNVNKLQVSANSDLRTMRNKAVQSGSKIVAVEEMSMLGGMNSPVITLELENTNVATDYSMMFGTPLGIASEYLSVPLNTTFPNIMFTGLADLVDNQGVGIPFLQLLNKRFVRKPVYISHVEVIAEDNATGQEQKSESVRYFDVPYNSATDSAIKSGKYTPVFTEYTAVTILGAGVMAGEFNGFAYKLLATSKVRMNIYLAAIDTPTFVYR